MRRTRVDCAGLAAYWVDRVETLLRACMRDRDGLPPERAIDVRWADLMADDLDTVTQIYASAGFELTRAARAALVRFRTENPRGKHGRVAYDLQGDFGLDPAEVRSRFDFYFERFGVTKDEA
jgi:hypothetical protein